MAAVRHRSAAHRRIIPCVDKSRRPLEAGGATVTRQAALIMAAAGDVRVGLLFG